MLYDRRTVATVLSDCLGLLENAEDREDLGDALVTDDTLVWNDESYDDDNGEKKIEWEPQMTKEILSLVRILSNVIEPQRIVITRGKASRDSGFGEYRFSATRYSSGSSAWRLHLEDLFPDPDCPAGFTRTSALPSTHVFSSSWTFREVLL